MTAPNDSWDPDHPEHIDCVRNLKGWRLSTTDQLCSRCKTLAEIEGGRAISIKHWLSQQFNPDHDPKDQPNARIDPAERARRDEHKRKYIMDWSKHEEG